MSILRGVRVAILVVASAAGLAASGSAGQAAGRVVAIEVGDNMKFSLTAITAKPGEQIRIVLKDVGQMPKVAMAHNFVLLKKGANPKAFVDKSVNARDTEFIAPAVKDQVLASTRLVGPGETAEASFAAPRQPGEYTFLCSFPGHFALGMKGILTVK